MPLNQHLFINMRQGILISDCLEPDVVTILVNVSSLQKSWGRCITTHDAQNQDKLLR